MALKWNRVDIAKTDVLTGKESFQTEQLENLMQLALLENKADFAALLLENGIVIKQFLTKQRLIKLYQDDTVLFFFKF